MEGRYVEHAAQVYQMDAWPQPDLASLAADGTILVVDPATRKLSIPVAAVAHTQALLRSDRVPSICMLYLQGRCRQGMHCHQLHADPAVVQMLRNEVSMRASCCPEHGEEVSQPSLPELDSDLAALTLEGQAVPAARIATTNGMRRMIQDRDAAAEKEGAAPDNTLQKSQICRLHLQGRCRYAEDCNFIHLCRGLGEGDASPELMKVLAGIAQSTPGRPGRPSAPGFGFSRGSFAGTPSSAFVPPMPPSPLYAGAPQTPGSAPVEGFAGLDHQGDSNGTSPPKSPSQSVTTPISGPWRRDPYSWDVVVSPVRATPTKAALPATA